MLEWAIWFIALAGLHEGAADRHAILVILVQEAARIAPHAQASQPVRAHGLRTEQAEKLVS
jgi:hypothetical protein